MSFRSAQFTLLFLACLLSSGCGSAGPERAPAIGEAWIGPANLPLHREVDPRSPVTGIAKHGDQVEIVGQRRRWYKVRTPKGAEGWVDDRQLMDGNQMKRLQALAQETAGLPSQGVATTFDVLNVHTEPNRLSASFVQVKEGEKFDVIAHRVHPRGPLPKRQLLPPKPKAQAAAKKPKKEPPIPPPPAPNPPPLPTDWVELSKQSARVPEEDLPPVARDDWTLIRTHAGQSGWVLTSRLFMSIPDQVAQYAEGHRIMAYFSLGKVTVKPPLPNKLPNRDREGGVPEAASIDNDEEKDIWLWATAESLGRDYDFDGYRVFTWNTRRHRYETAYIQRRVRGFAPVLVKEGQFSVCLEKPDGSFVRKRYGLVGNSVRSMGEEGCERRVSSLESSAEAHIVTRQVPIPEKGLVQQLKERLSRMTGK